MKRPERPVSMSPGKKITLTMVSVSLAAGAVLLFFMEDDPEQWIKFIVNRNTHWVLFTGFMAVLPIFGFPISVFLFLAAVKFGFALAVLVTLLVIPLHLIGSWALAKTLLYPHMEDFLTSKGYQLPRIPSNRSLLFTALFVLVPGPPYFLKNYLLALSGLRFRYYFGINWTMELAVCIPVVGLGRSAVDMNFGVAGLFAALIAALYLLSLRLKKKFYKTE